MKTLRQTREQLGLSQENMAALLGISRAMLSKVECGKRQLNHESFLQFNQLCQSVTGTELPRKRSFRGLQIPRHPRQWLEQATDNLQWKGRRMLLLADLMERRLLQAEQCLNILPASMDSGNRRAANAGYIGMAAATQILGRIDRNTITQTREMGQLLMGLGNVKA